VVTSTDRVSGVSERISARWLELCPLLKRWERLRLLLPDGHWPHHPQHLIARIV
jgi:hypothetical protein